MVPGTHWAVIAKDVVNEVIPVTKYKSQKTGITVIISEVEGPLVNGYFPLGKKPLQFRSIFKRSR